MRTRAASRAPGTRRALTSRVLLASPKLGAPPAARRPPRGLALTLLLAATLASAQPYAADGGFGEPVRVASGTLPVVAAAAGEGAAYVVTADESGVIAFAAPPSEAGPLRVAESSTVRGVWATVSGGELAVAWVERDRATGQTRHWLTFRGESHLLFTHTQETPLVVGPGADGPWVLAPLREEEQARLTLFTWRGGAPVRDEVLYATHRSVRGAYALDDPDPGAPGPAWVAWLEGETQMTPVGLRSEWNAYVMPAAPGAPVADLGLADVLDERQTVALGRGQEGAVLALWRAQEANLQASRVERASGRLVVTDEVDLGEVGRPVAWSGGEAYWLEGPYLRRAAPFAGGEPVSVAWSPVLVAEASLAAPADGGAVTLAWYGRAQGGEVRVYASDDSAPFEPGFVGRLAASMGWSPWNVWEEAAGQALTAVIVGVVAAIAVAPALFLASLLLPRLPGVRVRPVAAGAVLGIVLPSLLVALLAWRVPGATAGAGSLLGLPVSLAVGALVGYLATRRGDREAQLHVLVSSAVTVLVGLTLWSFAYYRTWAPFVGL